MEALRCHPHGPGDHHQKQNAVHQDGHGREDHHAYSERGGIVKSKWWRMILIWYYIYIYICVWYMCVYTYIYIYTYIYNVYIYMVIHTHPRTPPKHCKISIINIVCFTPAIVYSTHQHQKLSVSTGSMMKAWTAWIFWYSLWRAPLRKSEKPWKKNKKLRKKNKKYMFRLFRGGPHWVIFMWEYRSVITYLKI